MVVARGFKSKEGGAVGRGSGEKALGGLVCSSRNS